MSTISWRTLTVAIERFPIAGVFTIARGAKTEAGGHTGRGECVPYARHGALTG